MAKAFFISESILKQDSILNENIDPKYLRSLIDDCQDLYILPILGSALYNDLVNKIDTEATLTSDELNLLDNYVTPCLKRYIISEAGYELTFKHTNKNVGIKNSEFSQPANIGDLRDVMNHFKNKAELFAKKLEMFLKANTTIYPLYLQSGNTIDSITPIQDVFDSGMFLGDDDCGCGEYINGRLWKSRTERP